MRTVLIASGAYVDHELEAEFGRIPPTFLPIGNRRLFTRQIETIRPHCDRLLLSLPEDFEPDQADRTQIDRLGAEAVHVPPGLSLGESIVFVINVTASSSGQFGILLGDTLLTGLDWLAADAVSIDRTPTSYSWGRVRLDQNRVASVFTAPLADPVETGDSSLSGWFCFADPSLLVQSVTRQRGNFIDALGDYSRKRSLTSLVAEQWLDFGHSATYHQSRRRITTEREFNRLSNTRRSVIKSSVDHHKISAEAEWFATLPAPLRIYAPHYLGSWTEGGAVRYSIEYLHLPTLTELYVFGRVTRARWSRIFAACDEFLSACAAHEAPADPERASVQAIYGAKTFERLETLARDRGLDITRECRLNGVWLPSLWRMAELAIGAIDPSTAPPTLVHGDFCFSNILFDLRAELVRVIDPRGLDAERKLTAYGDKRYDIAKLHHSVVGLYDHILAGYFDLRKSGDLAFDFTVPATPALRGIAEEFAARTFAGLTPADASADAIAVLLFLSMLPLHGENPVRQDALMANAMRMFLALDRAPATALAGL